MRIRFLVFMLAMSALMALIDFYVLRRWKKYAAVRPRLRRTILPLTILLWTMPFVMPLYAVVSRWWDGGIARGVVVGWWAFHYAPRTMIAAWLAVVDVLRGLGWIGKTIKRQASKGEGQTPTVSIQQPEATASLPETVRNQPETANRQPESISQNPETGNRQPNASRRDFLRTAGWSLAAVSFVAVGTGLFKTVYDFEVRRVRVPVAGLPRALRGLRIAQISDLHAGSFFSSAPADEAARMLVAERPDLVVVTGDFVNHDAAELPKVLPALQRLRADLGVFGILGNHDHYADVPTVLRGIAETPVRMLVNARQTLRVDGGTLHLLGTDNTGFGQRHADLPRTLDGLPASANVDDLRVLLTHDPSFWDEARAATGVHLTLSGHTHGGQIGLEWARASATPRGVNLADLRYDRTAGLYTETGPSAMQHLYVNRGLGTTGPPLRLGIRPEITVLELVAA